MFFWSEADFSFEMVLVDEEELFLFRNFDLRNVKNGWIMI